MRRDLAYTSYNYYNIVRNLSTCESQEVISNLENIANQKVLGGTGFKRTDLMPYIEKEFANVNPSFIKWARENLIPSPSNVQGNGLTYQFIYQLGYKDKIRAMALLKLMIATHGAEELARGYAYVSQTMHYDKTTRQPIMRDYPYDISGFLESKARWLNDLFQRSGYGIRLDNQDYGFYLRRMLDGSEPEIWQTMKYILKRYDGAWYQETFVNKKWPGLITIDSSTYYQKRLISGVDSIILSLEAIPAGIYTKTETDFTISAINGKVINYKNIDNSGDMETDYNAYGYWVSEQKILIEMSVSEGTSTFSIDINTGERKSLEGTIYPSKEGDFLAIHTDQQDIFSDQEQWTTALTLSSKDGSEIAEFSNVTLTEGFWIGDEFYLRAGKNDYRKLGVIRL